MKKIFSFLMVALFSASMWAATETTVYYAVPSSVVGSYTVKLNTNQQTNPDAWFAYVMTDTGLEYEGNPIYSASFTDLWDGVDKMQFQLYDGDEWKSQIQPISSWTGATAYNGKMWIHGGDKWVELSGEEADPTISIKGAWDSWATITPLVLSTDKKTASLAMEMSEGIYEFGLELNGSWTANESIFNREANSHEVTGGGDNMKLNVDADGEYTFTWTFETNTLTVTYPDVVVIPATFYLTGDSALVVDAGLDKSKAWSPSAIKVTEDSYVLSDLKADQEYKLKVTIDGDWKTGKGCSDLTVVTPGINTDGDNNIVFKMAKAGNVTVTYKVVDETTTFTVVGDFVLPVVALAGTFNDWSQAAMSVADDKLSASIKVNLTVGVDSFKVVKDGAWLSLYGEDGNYRVNRGWPKALDVNVDGAPNFVIDVDKAGEYTFRWEYSSNSLYVTFPALESFDVTISAAEHVSISVKDGETPIGEKVEERKELTVLASADEGFRVVNLRAFKTGEPETTIDIIDGKLTMPDFAITIAADAADHLADGYYLVGTFTSWLPEAQYLFEVDPLAEEDVEEYIVAVNLVEGDGIKVVKLINDEIDTWYPTGIGNEYVVDAAHAGFKMVFFRPQGNFDWDEFGGYIYIGANEPELPNGYYLVGTFTSWLPEAEYLFEKNLLAEEDVEEYILEVTLEEGDGIKVAKLINDVIDTWYPSGYNTEYKVDAAHAGDKIVYFRPASNIDWAAFGGFFYIEPNAPTAVDNTEATVKVVKSIENGQLVIIKNGVRYNAQGTVVK